MRACISTSERRAARSLAGVALAALFLSFPSPARAADDSGKGGSDPGKGAQHGGTDDEEPSDSPFTKYGEFNEDADEAEEAYFLANGRLFGFSLGAGFQGATGNRGALWEGGAPLVDVKVHYWFDFNFALDLQFYNVQHNYQVIKPTRDRKSVSMSRLGLDFKYYFDTKNLASAVSFANPYLLGGLGTYSKSEASESGTNTQDAHVGFALGGGLEFALKPRKTYFYFEGRIQSVTFQDTYTDIQAEPTAQPRLADYTGFFYTFAVGVLFTW